MADEVLGELWHIKEAMAQEYAYHVTRLAADLQGKTTRGGTPHRGLAGPAQS